MKSFLKLNELIFKPYDALDLQKILRIRVEKALHPGSIEAGVIEKIAAVASRDHGDARQAVTLLAKGAYLAEKAGKKVDLELVDEAASQLEQDRYLMLIRTAPVQMKAAMAAVIEGVRRNKGSSIATGEAYDAYKSFCRSADLRPLTGRAFGDLLTELDMYSFLRSRVLSRGRYGRTREIVLELPDQLLEKISETILSNLQLR